MPDEDIVQVIQIGCQFCDEVRCKDPLTDEGIRTAMASYVAHLVESHWDVLRLGRARREATGLPVDDSWTRL